MIPINKASLICALACIAASFAAAQYMGGFREPGYYPDRPPMPAGPYGGPPMFARPPAAYSKQESIEEQSEKEAKKDEKVDKKIEKEELKKAEKADSYAPQVNAGRSPIQAPPQMQIQAIPPPPPPQFMQPPPPFPSQQSSYESQEVPSIKEPATKPYDQTTVAPGMFKSLQNSMSDAWKSFSKLGGAPAASESDEKREKRSTSESTNKPLANEEPLVRVVEEEKPATKANSRSMPAPLADEYNEKQEFVYLKVPKYLVCS